MTSILPPPLAVGITNMIVQSDWRREEEKGGVVAEVRAVTELEVVRAARGGGGGGTKKSCYGLEVWGNWSLTIEVVRGVVVGLAVSGT
jgi:hypothetical protein